MSSITLPTITVPATVGTASAGVLASSLSSINRTFNYAGLMPGDTLDLQGANADVPSDYGTIRRTTYGGSPAVEFTIIPENSIYYRVFRVQKDPNDPGTGRTLIVSGTDSTQIIVVTPALETSTASLVDISVVAAQVHFGSLVGGTNGIVVTAHPTNIGIVRVGGSDTTASRGQPLGPGASYTFTVANANLLYAFGEVAGPNILCVSQG